VVALAGCFSSNSETPVQSGIGGGGSSGHRGASGGGGSTAGGSSGRASGSTGNSTGSGSSTEATSSGSASTGSNSGSSTSLSSGSSGSSSGSSSSGAAATCSALAGDQGNGIFDCAAPQLIDTAPAGCTTPYFASTVQDLASCGAVCGATVTLLDQNGATISGASALSGAESGIVEICLAGDYTYTPTVQATGYPLFYYGEVHNQLSQPIDGLGVMSNQTIAAFGGFIPGYSSTTATFVAYTYTFGQCPLNAGWSVALTLPDGGAWPGGYKASYSAAGTGVPSATLTATTAYGVALLADIDTSVAQVGTLVFTNPDAGPCGIINQEIGLTGHIRLSAGDFSVQPIFVP
jgi:hypothetical protein